MATKPKAVAVIAAGNTKAAPDAPRHFNKAVEALKLDAETATATTSSSTVIAALGQAKTNIEQGVTRAMSTTEQITQFHQGNMEAMVKAGQIWATGLQDLTKHFASNAQATMEETMSTFRAMTTAKSLKEAFELQSTFAKTAMEKALSESSKLTESGMKLAEQAYAPITARVNAAVEVFTNRA